MPFTHKKLTLILVTLLFLLFTSGCSQTVPDHSKVKISTGILPIKEFARIIGGEYVEVEALIPVGANPHNYQPSPSSMKFLSDADLYIYIGVPTENDNIMPKIYDFNKEIRVLNLQEGLAEAHPFLVSTDHDHDEADHDHDENDAATTDSEDTHAELIHFEAKMLDATSEIGAYADYDPHTWVSPKRAITIATQIMDTLVQIDPQHKDTYTANANELINQLTLLDQTITDAVSKLHQKTFLIYHSSYNYFASDYGLSFISIENEGKTPTIQDIQKAIDIARENQITTIFYQNEFSVEQAKSISEQINGNAIPLEPLSEDYFGAMNNLIQHLNE